MGADLDGGERAAVEAIVGAAVESTAAVWGRSHAVLTQLADGRSVMVKRPRRRDDAEGPSDEARARFANERACLELLAGGGIAPELLGVSGEPELLVMEALPPGRALAARLLGDDPAAARSALVEYARALATMHASTVGREASFAGDGHTAWVDWVVDGVDGFVASLDILGIAGDAAALRRECDVLIHELGGAGWWRALTHGDPCPDNTRIEDATGRFRIFDFEHTSYGHALTDASYVVAPFPTCWCFGRVPEDISTTALAAYRHVLAETVPEAADDGAWADAFVVALAAPVVARGNVFRKALTTTDDELWGTTNIRVRLRQWSTSFLAAANDRDRFPALRGAVQAIADDLDVRWADAQLPDYPSLRTGAATTTVIPAWWSPDL